jgi:hypothetical protein
MIRWLTSTITRATAAIWPQASRAPSMRMIRARYDAAGFDADNLRHGARADGLISDRRVVLFVLRGQSSRQTAYVT